MASTDAVKVVIRIRPLNDREQKLNSKVIARPKDVNSVTLEPGPAQFNRSATATLPQTRTFRYHHVYADTSEETSPETQQTIYKEIGSALLDNAFLGFNCTLLAYGQTGSGKSFSMMGYIPTVKGGGITPIHTPTPATSYNGIAPTQGIIPRICQQLFERAEAASKADPNVSHKVEASYLEIYAERIRDLLDSRKKSCKIREHPTNGPYVEDLSVCAVNSFTDLDNLMTIGNKERTVAATNMNAISSRSHSVFTIVLTTTRYDEVAKLSSDAVSKIQLVDLAGSERVDQSGVTGVRLKEATNINLSLSTLGRVINALATRSLASDEKSVSSPKKKDTHVPFRDSVLTYLLKESLGGNSKTVMIACVSPADVNYDETLSTLRYAANCQNIVNKAVVNEDPNAQLIRDLREEIDALKSKLGEGEVATQELSRLRDVVAENARAMAEMERQWQVKLDQTRRIQEQQMEDMQAKGISMIMDNALPFLVNLNEDPSMSESLIYHIRPGRTHVGSAKPESGDDNTIILTGISVRPFHALMTNQANHVTVTVQPGATQPDLFVNGEPLTGSRSLNHGDRLVIGQHHFFRFSKAKIDPNAASATPAVSASASASASTTQQQAQDVDMSGSQTTRKSLDAPSLATTSTSPNMNSTFVSNAPSPFGRPIHKRTRSAESKPDVFDFAYAQRELMAFRSHQHMDSTNVSNRGSPTAENATRRLKQKGKSRHGSITAIDADEAAAAAATLPLPPPSPSPSASANPDENESPRYHILQFHSQTGDEKTSAPVPEAGPLVVTKSSLEELVRIASRFQPKQKIKQQFQLAQEAATLTVRNAVLASQTLWVWKFRRMQSKLAEDVMKLVFMSDEANAICAALGRPDRFRVELVTQTPISAAQRMPSKWGVSPIQRLRYLKQTSVRVVQFLSSGVPLLWDRDSFIEQLYTLREIYSEMLETGELDFAQGAAAATTAGTRQRMGSTITRVLNQARIQTIGVAQVYLEALRYGQEITHKAQVLDPRGEFAGNLTVHLAISSVRHGSSDDTASPSHRRRRSSTDATDAVLSITIHILHYEPSANTPVYTDVICRYRIHDDPESYSTSPADVMGIIKFDYTKTHYFDMAEVDPSMLDYLQYDAIQFELSGRVDDSATAAAAAAAASGASTSTSPVTGLTITPPEDTSPPSGLTLQVPSSPSSGDIASPPTPTPQRVVNGFLFPAGNGRAPAGETITCHRSDQFRRRSVSRISSPSAASTHQRAASSPNAASSSSLGTISEFKKVLEDEYTQIRTSQDHKSLLYVCVDIEESDKNGIFTAAPLKTDADEGDGVTFRLSSGKQRRFVISIMQCDQAPFLLESFAAVAVQSMAKQSQNKEPMPISTDIMPLVLDDQTIHVDHKLLIVTGTCPALDDHPYLQESSASGDRGLLSLSLALYLSKTTQPVLLEHVIAFKLYKGDAAKSGFFKKQAPTPQAERLPRIGSYYSIARESSLQSVTNVFLEHESCLEKIQRRMRRDQLAQHAALLTQLDELQMSKSQDEDKQTEKEKEMVSPRYVALEFRKSMDTMLRGCVNQSEESIVFDPVSGMQITVELEPRSFGTKCGFLSKRGAAQKDWKLKWCVLRPPFLFYYNKRTDKKERGIIHLIGSTVTIPDARELNNEPHTFCITTQTRPYYLQAASDKDLEAWLKAIGANVNVAQEQAQQHLIRRPSMSTLLSSPSPLNSQASFRLRGNSIHAGMSPMTSPSNKQRLSTIQ